MAAALRQRSTRSWRWTALVHVLVLALILAVGSPFPAEAEHHPHPSATTAAQLTPVDPAPAGHSDACLICHHHCGCHQAVYLDPATALPLPVTLRLSYRPTQQQVVSISTEGLLRPPRV